MQIERRFTPDGSSDGSAPGRAANRRRTGTGVTERPAEAAPRHGGSLLPVVGVVEELARGCGELRRLGAAVERSADPRDVRRLVRALRRHGTQIDGLRRAARSSDPLERDASGCGDARIDGWPEQWLG